MAKRNFSMEAYWLERARTWQPKLAFTGSTPQHFAAWHTQAYETYMRLLGDMPDPVPLDAEVEYSVEDNGLIRERVVFDSEQYMSVPCIVLRPANMAADASNPAIICSHGHGAYGKDPVAGMRSSVGMLEDIEQCNYNYGEQMARAGYLTISPDLRGFGERKSPIDLYPGRDTCNINYVKGSMMGIYTLTLNVFDIMRCVDYLQTRPEVDPERIGMMGLSQGGTMTTFAAAADPRIKAADIIGYVNPWAGFGLERANFCGSQIVPQIYAYFDTHDIAGLIAPRPLLLEMGIYDDCFFIQDMLKGHAGVQRIYDAAGVGEHLWADIHSGPHAFAANKAFAFFDKYL